MVLSFEISLPFLADTAQPLLESLPIGHWSALSYLGLLFAQSACASSQYCPPLSLGWTGLDTGQHTCRFLAVLWIPW